MSNHPNQGAVFNLEEALARVDQDRETFMMIEVFLEHGRKDLAHAQATLTAGDAAWVAQSSHWIWRSWRWN